MINDYIRKGLVIVAFVTNPHKLLVEVGFYQYKPYDKTITINSAKNEYQENLSFCSTGDSVTIEEDDFEDKIVVYKDYSPIGTTKDVTLIGCRAYIHSLETIDSGKTKVKIAILVK